jgi:GNAT superfamily N-acetyltransferase
MADVSVRPAREEDAAELGRIQIETWQTAYKDILPLPVLDSLHAEDAAASWQSAIASPPSSRHHVLVALEQQWTVGFAALAPADADEPDLHHPEFTALIAPMLVEPRWGRRGHGSRLLAAAIEHARGDGMTHAIVWIPEKDEASKAFLTSAGWLPDGLVRALDTGAGEFREIRLHCAIA